MMTVSIWCLYDTTESTRTSGALQLDKYVNWNVLNMLRENINQPTISSKTYLLLQFSHLWTSFLVGFCKDTWPSNKQKINCWTPFSTFFAPKWCFIPENIWVGSEINPYLLSGAWWKFNWVSECQVCKYTARKKQCTLRLSKILKCCRLLSI